MGVLDCIQPAATISEVHLWRRMCSMEIVPWNHGISDKRYLRDCCGSPIDPRTLSLEVWFGLSSEPAFSSNCSTVGAA